MKLAKYDLTCWKPCVLRMQYKEVVIGNDAIYLMEIYSYCVHSSTEETHFC